MGYCQFGKAIPVDAPTGRWRVEFRTDPASKEAVEGMTLRIEEFLPERMKLDLASADAVLEPGQPFRLEATGAYLYRAPAADNRFTARLAVAVVPHQMEKLPGYFSGDPTMDLRRAEQDVVDAKPDAKGQMAQDIPYPA